MINLFLFLFVTETLPPFPSVTHTSADKYVYFSHSVDNGKSFSVTCVYRRIGSKVVKNINSKCL